VAHPAVGIVVAPDGAVFYTDNAQVWRIAPDGRKAVVVPAVHTHELWLDADGSLYGEHLEHEAGRWSHRVWRRDPAGRVTDVVPKRDGFRDDYRDFTFARDGRRRMYVIADEVLWRREASGGPPQRIAPLPGAGTTRLAVSAVGDAYFVGGGRLSKVSPDGAVTAAATLTTDPEPHAVMGLWLGPEGAVYAAVYAEGAVKRVDASGRVSIVSQSPAPWRPSGGATGSDGSLWILEVSPTNEQRVRRLSPSGEQRVH
jgi:streptogramin lyase